MKWLVPGMMLSLTLSGCGRGPEHQSAAPEPARPVDGGGVSESRGSTGERPAVDLEEMGLRNGWTDSYREVVALRRSLEEFQERFHRHDGEEISRSRLYRRHHRGGSLDGIRVVRPSVDPLVLDLRRSLGFRFDPPRGLRLPLEGGAEVLEGLVKEEERDEGMELAAEIVRQRLAHDGLLVSLMEVLRALGVARAASDPSMALARMRRAGFPTDLIELFPVAATGGGSAEALVAHWAARLAEGVIDPEELRGVRFVFRRSDDGFRSAAESGEEKIGLVRMQIGGGYYDGITPGGVIDMSAQLVESLPGVDFLMSVPAPVFSAFHQFARTSWPLKRSGQVTFVEEPLPVTGWAQDAGKSGVTTRDGRTVLATLVPRFASVDEAPVMCVPGDTFLHGGLRLAGHEIVQSRLLFQGGNLLTVRDGGSGERVLLLSESEVRRNVALGLTAEQVTEAFRVEFGVARCVVMGSVSHHLDFDVSVRTEGRRTIAFVNDAAAAATIILERGVDALLAGGELSEPEVSGARGEFREGRERALFELLEKLLGRARNSTGVYPPELTGHFAENAGEAAGPNFRTFLTAMDLLACRVLTTEEVTGRPDGEYLLSLCRLLASAKRQADSLRQMGWVIAPVPSLPDTGNPVNYLNGIQDASAYIMPVHGGFYSSLDRRAREAFRSVLGSGVKLIPIRSSECQRQHGAVHCAAVAFPELAPAAVPGS